MSDRAEGPKGLWVTGHMRSGTSMVAGLFVQHGVFFGDCLGPTVRNRKGNFEHLWLRRGLKGGNAPEGWPDRWLPQLRREGWDGVAPWGAKAVAVHWREMVQAEPDVIVLCYRPKPAILASCARFGAPKRYGPKARSPVVDRHWEIMDRLASDYDGLVVRVDTPRLVDGDASQLAPAFDALGLALDQETCDDWIEPTMWHQRHQRAGVG